MPTEIVLGLDTSCYTTSLAAVDLAGRVLGSFRRLLKVPPAQRGLRQAEAVFQHVRQLPELFAQMHMQLPDTRPVAVCASSRPRDEDQSYMPVFQVGDAQARTLSSVLGIPCFHTTHQRGHLSAAAIDSGLEQEKDFLALHLSGGTMDLLCMRGGALQTLGGTADLHAGQLVDRTGVAMGLAFPAGPELEAMAREGSSSARIPVSMEQRDLVCHLSGAETRVMQWIRTGDLPRECIAREVYDFLSRTVARLLGGAREKTGMQHALLAGGVASSLLFREMLTDRCRKKVPDIRLHFGKPEYSGDNAAGVARIGLDMLNGEDGGHSNG